MQNNLGVALANLAQESVDSIPLLREALSLITISANTGYQSAKENIPIVQAALERASHLMAGG